MHFYASIETPCIRFIFVFRHRIHANTVRGRLRAAGLGCRRPLKASRLTQHHRRERLRWARHHITFTQRRWNCVLFSDETRVRVSRADGRQHVWRRRHERYADACVLQYNPWGGGSIHVWGGITRHNRTRLVVFNRNVNANVYTNEVLANVVVPFMQDTFPEGNGILQQDGARPHTARATLQFI